MENLRIKIDCKYLRKMEWNKSYPVIQTIERSIADGGDGVVTKNISSAVRFVVHARPVIRFGIIKILLKIWPS